MTTNHKRQGQDGQKIIDPPRHRYSNGNGDDANDHEDPYGIVVLVSSPDHRNFLEEMRILQSLGSRRPRYRDFEEMIQEWF